MARHLTAAHVCEASGYARDQLHAVKRAIGYKGRQPTQARVAQEYERHELIFFGVLRELEITHGVRRIALRALYPLIQKEILVPRDVAPKPCLLVTVKPAKVTYFGAPTEVEDGIVVALHRVVDQVDRYLQSFGGRTTSLNLNPAIVRPKKQNRIGGKR